MGRPHRIDLGGYVYHVLNRANAGIRMFRNDRDYAAFEMVMVDAMKKVPMRLLAYCLMPNHWHLVVWPRKDGDLSKFCDWLELTHTQRWHAHRQNVGTGHIYQGRYKSFGVYSDEYFLEVFRYVERNALTGDLVGRAEHWRWGSL